MSEIIAKLHAVEDHRPIQAIKALRAISGGGLRWAKMDVYDRVKLGHVVCVPVPDAAAIDELNASGWTATAGGDAVISFTVRVPIEKMEDTKAVIRALGGSVDV